MKDLFREAQVGDYVWDQQHGDGKISYINPYITYSVVAEFSSGTRETYTLEGKQYTSDRLPSLFYEKQIPNKVTELQKPEIDWVKVPTDTPVLVSSSLAHAPLGVLFLAYLPSANYKFITFSPGEELSTANGSYQHLFCTIDESKVKIKKEWLK